uniref:Uncharacterized protein n=2 Tax=Oryza brachyantha TaxID=4533 RepID=J3LVQ4_ORYBR
MPAATLRLTGMDSALSALPIAALFVFDRPVDQPAETLRRALSRALVLYYPIAGRLVDGGHDGLGVACTGEGVAFVAASASCTLRDAMLFESSRPPAIALEELAVTFDGMCMEDPPLVLMQVTEFACGGFVVGVTWNHAIADGTGMAQFLQDVGELCRGTPLPSAVPPTRWDYSLPELPQDVISSTEAIVSCEPHDYASSYITVPMSFINRVKAEFSRREAPSPCSLFEVVVAAIWQCRARATMSSDADAGDPLVVVFTANVRKQAQAKPGYYGNCFTFQMAVARRGEVANGGVVELVERLKDAKRRIPYTFEMDGRRQPGGAAGGVLMEALRRDDALLVSSWWNLGFDDVDFGGGSPARVMYNMERKMVPSCFLCGRKGKDGVGAMALCVGKEHAEAFHAELGRLH